MLFHFFKSARLCHNRHGLAARGRIGQARIGEIAVLLGGYLNPNNSLDRKFPSSSPTLPRATRKGGGFDSFLRWRGKDGMGVFKSGHSVSNEPFGLNKTYRLAAQRRLLKFAGESVSMLAALLYRIHRPVRLLNQALNIPCALRIQRNPDAGGQETALISDLIGCFD